MWISPRFQLLLVKEYQRLKEDESDRLRLQWDFHRTLAKVNYHIHTDAIKENLIQAEMSKQQASQIYANEADVLNMALFTLCFFKYGKHQCITNSLRIRTRRTSNSSQMKSLLIHKNAVKKLK